MKAFRREKSKNTFSKLTRLLTLAGFLAASLQGSAAEELDFEAAPGAAAAAGITVITLSEAIAKAEEANFSLQKSAIDLAAAKRARDNLWSEVFNGISVRGQASYGSVGIVKPAAKDPSPSWGVSGSVGVQLSAALPATMSLIRLSWQTSFLNYETAKKQLGLTVTKAFYRLLASEQNLGILRERFTNAEREAAQAKISYANGLINEVNNSRSQLLARQAQYELERAESTYRQDLDAFLVSIGEESALYGAAGAGGNAAGTRGAAENTRNAAGGVPGMPVKLEGAITIRRQEPDAEALIAQFLPGRPDIAAARRAQEKAALTYRERFLQNKTPSLSVSGSYSGTPSSDFSDYADGVSFSVSVSVPLESWIPGTAANQAERAAAAEVEKARLDLAAAEQQARQNIRVLCETLHTSWKTIEIARQSAELARRAYEMSARAFREGATDVLTLENDRAALASAQQNRLAEELNYKLTVLDLAQALNVDAGEFFGETR